MGSTQGKTRVTDQESQLMLTLFFKKKTKQPCFDNIYIYKVNELFYLCLSRVK
jgi:hypothetical protein